MNTIERKLLRPLEETNCSRCAGCAANTAHQMTHCYIDVDDADSGGVPILIGYKCVTCGHRKSYTRRFKLFEVLAGREDN